MCFGIWVAVTLVDLVVEVVATDVLGSRGCGLWVFCFLVGLRGIVSGLVIVCFGFKVVVCLVP